MVAELHRLLPRPRQELLDGAGADADHEREQQHPREGQEQRQADDRRPVDLPHQVSGVLHLAEAPPQDGEEAPVPRLDAAVAVEVEGRRQVGHQHGAAEAQEQAEEDHHHHLVAPFGTGEDRQELARHPPPVAEDQEQPGQPQEPEVARPEGRLEGQEGDHGERVEDQQESFPAPGPAAPPAAAEEHQAERQLETEDGEEERIQTVGHGAREEDPEDPRGQHRDDDQERQDEARRVGVEDPLGRVEGVLQPLA